MIRLFNGDRVYTSEDGKNIVLRGGDYPLAILLAVVQFSSLRPIALVDQENQQELDMYDNYIDPDEEDAEEEEEGLEIERPMCHYKWFEENNAGFSFESENYVYTYTHNGYHFSETVKRKDGSVVYKLEPNILVMDDWSVDLEDISCTSDFIEFIKSGFNSQEFVPLFVRLKLYGSAQQQINQSNRENMLEETHEFDDIMEAFGEITKVEEEWKEIFKYSSMRIFDEHCLPIEPDLNNVLLGVGKLGKRFIKLLDIMGEKMGKTFIYVK